MTARGLYRSPLVICFLILAALPQALSAADGSIIHGKWDFNPDKTVAAMSKHAKKDDPEMGLAMAMFGQMKGMELTVTADVMSLAMPDPEDPKTMVEAESMKYVVKSVEGNTVVVETTPEGGGKVDTATFTLEGKVLSMTNSNTSLVFTKKP